MKDNRRNNSLLCGTFFMGLLALLNMHLFQGDAPSSYVFRPEEVVAGQWWRIVTHPFVHVSWYHLLLDASAVMILWREMGGGSLMMRCVSFCLCALGSLVFALVFSSVISQTGFCGLSGVAHGMMVMLGLQWLSHYMRSREGNLKIGMLGLGVLLVVLGKGLYEITVGTVAFSGMHLGDLGVPVVESHLGGIVGGCVAFFLVMIKDFSLVGEFELKGLFYG